MRPAARRGQPLAVLVLLLVSWVAARAAIWETPFGAEPDAYSAALLAAKSPQAAPVRSVFVAASTLAAPDQNLPHQAVQAAPAPAAWPTIKPYALQSAAPSAPTMMPTAPVAVAASPKVLTPRVAAGHQMLWLAAVGYLPLPAVLFEQRNLVLKRAAQQRWSADSWLFLRSGAGMPVRNGFSAPSYGASQVGAVLRYRLAPENARKPSLYLRASGAVRAPRGEEIALGLSARPLAGVPIVAMAELRASRLGSGTVLRPAAALVSEFPALDLPLGARAEAYGQIGYVGGSEGSGFVDGQLHLTRRVAKVGELELRAGGAVWGGAQKGASRVDIGPTASLGIPVGPANTRLSADWRFRVAGSAAPGSGPAVTLSAGF